MHPTVTQYAQALEELSLGTSPSPLTLVKNLVRLLKRDGRSSLLPAILGALESREAEHSGVLAVRIVTAHTADGTTEKLLRKKAKALFSGKKIVATFGVDPSVIGGVRFETEEAVYDATVATELAKLRKSISK
jgi:F-type H+-transporting ATPase subunit delta